MSKPANLLQELDQWSLKDLDKLVPRILAMRARKLPNVVSRSEAGLLKKITAGPPARIMKEYDRLTGLVEKGGLTKTDEHKLALIIGEIDKHNLLHLQWLNELAGIRRVTVPGLVKQLGLKKSI